MSKTPKAPADDRLLRTSDAAAILNIRPHSVAKLIRSGELPRVNVGLGTERPRWRVRQSDLDAWIESRSS